jgi:hypothetical protein
MTLWSNSNSSGGAPKNKDINPPSSANGSALYQNVTSGAFVTGQTVGLHVVDGTEIHSTAQYGCGHEGWNVIRFGSGGLASITPTANAGANFANGETIAFSNGSAAGVGTVTTNATGNMVSVAITTPGLFTNTASVASAFNREKHLSSITVSGTPTGYSNTDVIKVSNGTVNGTATVVTNSTGGFVTANVTITGLGLWPNATTNAAVVFAVANSTGGASVGTGAVFAAGLINSTAGAVTFTLGGHAGRVYGETLVAMGTIAAGSNTNGMFP